MDWTTAEGMAELKRLAEAMDVAVTASTVFETVERYPDGRVQSSSWPGAGHPDYHAMHDALLAVEAADDAYAPAAREAVPQLLAKIAELESEIRLLRKHRCP